MEKQQNIPTTYHALWCCPNKEDRFYPEYCMGTLCYYGDRPSLLTLLIPPAQGNISSHSKQYDTLWGKDANQYPYTLFGSTQQEPQWDNIEFSKSEYEVRAILRGRHIDSIHTASYTKCIVEFPHLIDWAHNSRASSNANTITIDNTKQEPLLVAEVEDEVTYRLVANVVQRKNSDYGIDIKQRTTLTIESSKKQSIRWFLQHILEFSNFLSIALYAEQAHSSIYFTGDGKYPEHCPLLIELSKSITPNGYLIDFNKLKERLPMMMKNWHNNYEQLMPITNYLIDSMQSRKYQSSSDFLIVAQALDGYFKRFVNGKDGKDTKQYAHQIKKLVEHFKDVDAIRECNIDAEEMADTRHKYSHLIPDSDTKLKKAVDGEELYCLTLKGKILLTCCILDNLGLTIEEINQCCENKPITHILKEIDDYEWWKRIPNE